MIVTVMPWAMVAVVYSIFVARRAGSTGCASAGCASSIWGARVICGVRWRVQGLREPAGADGRSCCCPKHQSTWETFAFPTLMPHPLCYVFKRELLYIPFFGWAMARWT